MGDHADKNGASIWPLLQRTSVERRVSRNSKHPLAPSSTLRERLPNAPGHCYWQMRILRRPELLRTPVVLRQETHGRYC
jgi:hypothetical protein